MFQFLPVQSSASNTLSGTDTNTERIIVTVWGPWERPDLTRPGYLRYAGGSVLMDTALYFSSFPSKISSHSEAFSSVTLVAVSRRNTAGVKGRLAALTSRVQADEGRKPLSKLQLTVPSVNRLFIIILQQIKVFLIVREEEEIKPNCSSWTAEQDAPWDEAMIFFLSSTEASRLHSDG